MILFSVNFSTHNPLRVCAWSWASLRILLSVTSSAKIKAARCFRWGRYCSRTGERSSRRSWACTGRNWVILPSITRSDFTLQTNTSIWGKPHKFTDMFILTCSYLQLQTLLMKKGAVSPLYLRLASQELRNYASFEKVNRDSDASFCTFSTTHTHFFQSYVL